MVSLASMAIFTLAVSAASLVDGAGRNDVSRSGSNQIGLIRAPRLRTGRSLRNAIADNEGRRLLLPHPPHHHDGQDSKEYSGCLGLSKEELEEAWNFQGDPLPCSIAVQGTVVAGDDGSTGGSSSGGSATESGSSNGSSNGGGGGNGGTDDGTGNNSSGSDGGSDAGSSDSSGSSSSTTDDYVSAGGSGASDGSSSSSNGSNGGSDEDEDGETWSVLRYFNISDCDSYSNIWVWDLALSCENSTSLESCECTSASILHDYGLLECPSSSSGAPSCPEGCPVCSTCMRLLGPKMGCSSDDIEDGRFVPKQLQQDLSRAVPIAIGIVAAVASLVIGVSLYQYKKRSVAGGGLGAGLVEEDPPVNAML